MNKSFLMNSTQLNSSTKLTKPTITISCSSNESTMNDEFRSKDELNNTSTNSISSQTRSDNLSSNKSNHSIYLSNDCSTNSSTITKNLPDRINIVSSTTVSLSTTSLTNTVSSTKLSNNLQSDREIVKLDELKTTNKQSWLLRLFESKLFNASLALVYLYKSKEPGVLTYIGNKLFQFDKEEVDFYLPQLVTLYINNSDICDAIRPYFLSRCKESIHFSLHLLWLLQSFCFENKNCNHPLIKVRNSGLKLKQLILSEELWYDREQSVNTSSSNVNKNNKFSELNCYKLLELDKNNKLNFSSNKSTNSHYLTVKKTHHQRSFSETTSNLIKTTNLIELQLNPASSIQSLNQHLLNSNHILNQKRNHKIGDLQSGLAFDNQCVCLNTRNAVCNELKGVEFKCTCGAPRLLAENEFVKCLINIGKSLQCLKNKELRMQRLIAELQLLNLNLPSRVWSPLHDHINHLVVRIPPQQAVLLNSKDKAPFLIFIEIIKIDSDINTAILPTKTNSLRLTRSEENLFNYHQQLKYNNSSNCLVNSSTRKLDQLEYVKQPAEIRINASDIRKRLSNSIKTPKLNELDSEDLEDSNAVLTEAKIKQIRDSSPFGHLTNWQLVSMIVKCGDDLRQEMMCGYQLLSTFKKIWQLEKVPLYIRPYKIYVFSAESGLIEPILNTISLSQIKKNTKMTLIEYFIKEFGPVTSEQFLTAQRKFVQSCAAYSVVSYLIQLKDRHNGNILLDNEGHILHIDYGFILSTSPRNLGFENSPFKLTDEFIDLMGGIYGDMFKYYKILILQGIIAARKSSFLLEFMIHYNKCLIAARKHMEKIVSLVEILSNTQLPCFKSGSSTIKSLVDRFHIKLTEEQLQVHIEQLVENSIYSLTTKLYDSFQYYTNNIL